MHKTVLIGALLAAVGAGAQVEWNELPLGEDVFLEQTGELRSDTIDIPLGPYGELEYKLGMEAGETIVYEWNVVDSEDPDLLYSEFHGHTEPVDNVGDLMYYRKAEASSERGSLVAPFSGIHGWYLVNGSEAPIVIRLEVAGFYELLEQ